MFKFVNAFFRGNWLLIKIKIRPHILRERHNQLKCVTRLVMINWKELKASRNISIRDIKSKFSVFLLCTAGAASVVQLLGAASDECREVRRGCCELQCRCLIIGFVWNSSRLCINLQLGNFQFHFFFYYSSIFHSRALSLLVWRENPKVFRFLLFLGNTFLCKCFLAVILVFVWLWVLCMWAENEIREGKNFPTCLKTRLRRHQECVCCLDERLNWTVHDNDRRYASQSSSLSLQVEKVFQSIFPPPLKVEHRESSMFFSIFLTLRNHLGRTSRKKIEGSVADWHLPQLPPVRPRHSLVSLFHRNCLKPSHFPSVTGLE